MQRTTLVFDTLFNQNILKQLAPNAEIIRTVS